MQHSNQAKRLIDKFGGPTEVARLLGLSYSTVYRWMYPKGKNSGTGGTIPSGHLRELLAMARLQGVYLTAEDIDPRNVSPH